MEHLYKIRSNTSILLKNREKGDEKVTEEGDDGAAEAGTQDAEIPNILCFYRKFAYRKIVKLRQISRN